MDLNQTRLPKGETDLNLKGGESVFLQEIVKEKTVGWHGFAGNCVLGQVRVEGLSLGNRYGGR